MRAILVSILLSIPLWCPAQAISFDPYSMEAWGELRASTMISAEYSIIGVHGIFVHDQQYSPADNSPTPKQMFGVSLMSPYLLDILRGGIMYFTDPFPTPTDTRLNAFIEASLRTDENIRIHYRHISNAGTGVTNHGIDYVGLSIHF